MRLPWEVRRWLPGCDSDERRHSQSVLQTKKQISRQFVRFNPWWKPEYNAIIAEFERGTLTASKVFLNRVGFNDALDLALRSL